MQSMGEVGITLLLFMLGLELRLGEFKSVGKTVTILGILQILFTGVLGYILSIFLGYPFLSSLYISIALTFSSTIIIVKLLSDKKDLNSLYGKITIGILLFQDVFAVFILMLLSVFTKETQSSLSVATLFAVSMKGVVLFLGTLFLSKLVFPSVVDAIAKSKETLFLFSLSWVFGLSAFVSSSVIGFPIEIGGFLAGLALANSSENFQILSRVASLRDFFITIFFVFLGMGMNFSSFSSIFVPSLLLSLFVLLGKPIIVASVMGIMGYRKRTSFFSGLALSQISEFSLIIIFLGSKIGHIPKDIVSLVTLVSIITFTVSTYFISSSNKLYRWLSSSLTIFEKKNSMVESHGSTDDELSNLKDHVVLVGAKRMGKSILDALHEEKEEVVVVDFDPDVVSDLKQKGILSIFGDIADLDIQNRVSLKKAKHVISTVSDLEDNILLIKSLGGKKSNTKIVVVAFDSDDAKELYEAGADYVVLPHIAGGAHLAKIIKENNFDTIDRLTPKAIAFLKKQSS